MTVREARAEYLRLRRAVLGRVGPDERLYARILWAMWDYRLATLPQDGWIPNMASRVEVIRDPRLSGSALVEWLDAFPAAVWSESGRTD